MDKWSAEYELEYARSTSRYELMVRHEMQSKMFHLQEIISTFPDGAVVMEVGCGAAGGLLNFIPKRLARVAVDPLISEYSDSFWMCDDTIRLAEYANEITFPSSSVDLLICIEALDHCHDMDEFRDSCKEMSMLLKPEAMMIFMLPARSGPTTGHPCNPSSKECEKIFADCGLHVVRSNYPKEGTWLLLQK